MASIGQTASLPHALPARSKAGSGAWVTTREAFWIALEALRAHKLRSFLTLLGVVIATTTLIVVMSHHQRHEPLYRRSYCQPGGQCLYRFTIPVGAGIRSLAKGPAAEQTYPHRGV